MEAFYKIRTLLTKGSRYFRSKPKYFCSKSGCPKEDSIQPETVQKQESLVLPFSLQGDCGYSLVNNITIPKDNRIFCAMGDTDELICLLGAARENALPDEHPYTDKITRIQTVLFDILLTINKQSNTIIFPAKNTRELEEWIVLYSKDLTPAENYLLPGGGKVSTSLHIARSVCRRAERSVFPLVRDNQIDKEVQAYLNRLGDLLFVWARFAAKLDERSESVYTPKLETQADVEVKQKPSDTTKKDCDSL